MVGDVLRVELGIRCEQNVLFEAKETKLPYEKLQQIQRLLQRPLVGAVGSLRFFPPETGGLVDHRPVDFAHYRFFVSKMIVQIPGTDTGRRRDVIGRNVSTPALVEEAESVPNDARSCFAGRPHRPHFRANTLNRKTIIRVFALIIPASKQGGGRMNPGSELVPGELDDRGVFGSGRMGVHGNTGAVEFAGSDARHDHSPVASAV